MGYWSFRFNITVTSTSGSCGSNPPPPAAVSVEGVWNSTFFTYSDPVTGLSVRVTHFGAIWQLQFLQFGGSATWSGIVGNMAWDAISESWKLSGVRSSFSSTCVQNLDLEFVPEALMGEQVVRNKIDELTDDESHIWRWQAAPVNLVGSVNRRTHNGGQLWGPNHIRGLTRKYGSQALPWVTDVSVRFLY